MGSMIESFLATEQSSQLVCRYVRHKKNNPILTHSSPLIFTLFNLVVNLPSLSPSLSVYKYHPYLASSLGEKYHQLEAVVCDRLCVMWAYQRVARRGDWHSVHLRPHPSLMNKEKHTDGVKCRIITTVRVHDLLPMLERNQCLTMIKVVNVARSLGSSEGIHCFSLQQLLKVDLKMWCVISNW
ncbi:hypothetical protein MUK42_35793 [Musa troglodytarum]|uniref:Uncharacterized protein n=1 Tax=Musa troglodytarum TaxID=320322 RepID=A0A9E7JZF1_9LILI|nr:hypothetical protein MUK42_35793 [Musa troglodytarum]